MRILRSMGSRVCTGLAASVLLLGAHEALAQAVVDVTAAPTNTVTPDGQTVPMWGYICTVDSTDKTGTTSCGAVNPRPSGGGWSPMVIRVQSPASGTGKLTINLTNSLAFANGNNVPTSLVVLGQVGGGLGSGGTTAPSPAHAPQQVTWPVIDPTNTNPAPAQLPRVQSFATEVPAGQGTGSTVQLQWTSLQPGTYLIESGTHPSIQVPMGLYGILVVSPAGQAYPSVASSRFDADLPVVLSEIDPAQNAAVSAAVNTQGFSETAVWSGQNNSSVTVLTLTNPGSGYTAAPAVTIAPPPGTTGTPATAVATINTTTGAITSITITGGGSGYSSAPAVTIAAPPAGGTQATASALAGACGNATASAVNTCYPPAVNYSPRYYLVNGSSFDRTNLASSTLSTLAAPGTATTGNLLVRLVNAGSRMHIPAFVNLPMTLVAEDGNPVPGGARIQNEVFMAAGKAYDVMVQPLAANGAYTAATYPLFDRQLSLSTNNARDGGMQAYVAVNGGATTGVGSTSSAAALHGDGNKSFYCSNGNTLNIADASKGLLGGVTGANGVALVPGSLTNGGSVTIAANGTFTYTPPSGASCTGQFGFTINAKGSYTASITECDAASHPAGCGYGGPPVVTDDSYNSTNAKRLAISPPGILMNDVDPSGLPLTVDTSTVTAPAGVNLTVNPDGSFIAELQASATAAQAVTFTYKVKNSQQTASNNTATVTVNFPARSGLTVSLIDPKKIDPATKAPMKITDYRWIIEEDRTFWVDPKCQINTDPAAARPTDSYGRTCPALPVESIGYNFHTAHMPVVATGCFRDPSGPSTGPIASCESGQTLLGSPAICDIGNGTCRTTDANGNPLTMANAQRTPLDPGDVALDPAKHYYISVMPADGINPTIAGVGGPVTENGVTRPFDPAKDCKDVADYAAGTGKCGHNMSGGPIPPVAPGAARPTITIPLAETPLPVAKIAVLVYEDDFPLNGENDAGGGVDILAPNEPGLGSFQIVLLDQAGQLGDNTGQPTYDMFNMPLSNSLIGTVDPMTGQDACPVTSNTDHLLGMIVTCPKYEKDGKTLSPLAGQAVIDNLYPGLYEVQAFPDADREARGEEWLQTNTLDGGKPHEAFIRPGEPSYFQEFGPGGFHVQIGFANPKIINDRRHNASNTGLCDPAPTGGGLTCNSRIVGQVDGDHMSRTPDERTYDSGTYDAFSWSTCYVSVGIPDDMDIAFAKCNADGSFEVDNIPDGTYKVAVFDQWNDIMLDGLVTAVSVSGVTPVTLTAIQWRTNLYTRIYLDTDGNGIPTRDGSGNDLEQGIPLVPINIRYRDGSFGFLNQTDLNGYATYNEIFPLMNWLVVEPDTTRYKPTGEHVIYDAGGPDDCSPAAIAAYGGNGNCSLSAANLAGTKEFVPLPRELRVPGAVYCTDADCVAANFKNGTYFAGPAGSSGPDPASTAMSSGRIDPPWTTEGFQGLLGQHNFIDFGFKPFKAAGGSSPGENGGISGLVVYASTRPFDDPTFLAQLPWEPAVPNVRVNLYQETVAQDGTRTLSLVDSTLSSSWDDWAQGFRTDGSGTGTLETAADGVSRIPNMNCPGQDPTSGFFATLQGSKMWLDTADTSGKKKSLAYNSQFKCFDGWAMLNQIQPAPYDGRYAFPSVVDRDPTTGRPSGTGSLNGVANTGMAGTNCTVCIANPDDGNPMLPAGKYVVEVVVPPGFELVKEEDKNILMGDIFIAPVTQQFAGLGNVFILPDQAAMNAYYNANNAVNATTDLGATQVPSSGVLNTVQQNWPCVGEVRIVPDVMSLYPAVGQTAPFAGASRPLCDRKEVTIVDQMSAKAHFFVFTSNHIAGHFTGVMTNDMASEFDPFSPQFGEKFGAPNLPVNMRDFDGNQITRVYGDQWGVYNGLYPSSWEVNPPNPTGYGPQMSVACMNDPGPIPDVNGNMVTDPAYNPAYSNFCYEMPFMPGFTAYMDTPVTPVQAFADHYNLPDAEYPDGTPTLKRADFAGLTGPWASSTATHLVLTSFGDRAVQNPAYTGPSGVSSTSAGTTWGSKTITRHYGFGAQCTAVGGNCAAVSSVTIGGLPATINSWTDTSINVTVPSGLAACPGPVQQKQTAAQCGEVVITAGNGKQSFDGITVTIGGKAPKVVEPGCSTAGSCTTTFGEFYPNPLQTAIDNATAGDLIIVDAGTYRENLIMWKPVRLQGVGAGAVTINADAQPAGKMDAWRRRISCLFGLTIQGAPLTQGPASTSPGTQSVYDPSGTFTCPANMYFRDDRLPFEGFVGWDASSNGNLAQVLQEPSLMGAYEGAGVTVVGRGVNQSGSGNTDLWGQTAGAGQFADGSRYVNGGASRFQPNDCTTATTTATYADYGTANFQCNPSRIDGLSIINSSQGGGGVFLHGWNNNLQIANNRISANAGTLSGGINLGNGETPPAFTLDNTICGNTGAVPAPMCPPIPAGTVVGAQIPFAMNPNVHIHHNQVIANASIGDALFSGSPSGSGGITVSAGSDGYEIDHNWVAANLTSGDGGGIAHMGVSFNGKIDHNVVMFNEANNPTLPVDGGGIVIMGAQEDRTLASTGQECGGTTDTDCPPGIGDGTGPGLVIDSNLLLGNSALYGSGGGLRLRQTNGSEVAAFPATPNNWYGITVTNNIIADNVAGWDGGGVSLQDSFKTKFINNTVAANDTTASAGVLFKTLGAINAASPPPGCLPTPDPTQPQNPNCLDPNAPHIPQPAGLVTMQNTPNMMSQFATAAKVVCPAGFGYGIGTDTTTDASLTDGRCMLVSLPSIVNDIFWQNRAFHVEIVSFGGQNFGGSSTSLQNIVGLFPQANQQTTGQCVAPSSMTTASGGAYNGELYWDLGVRMDLLPDNNGHSLVFNSATVGGGYTLEAGATANIAGSVASVTIVAGGSGYTSAPNVIFVGGGGSGAAGTAVLTNGVVTGVTVTHGGTGYTSNPRVNLSGGGGQGALANSVLNATVASVTVFNGGTGYTNTPKVTFTGGLPLDGTGTPIGTQAQGTAKVVNGVVTAITLTNHGSGFISAPTVQFSGGGLGVNSAFTNNTTGIALVAKNSILSDSTNLANIAGTANLAPSSTPVQGQYCNGARIPPEQCTVGQGANDPLMCKGYFAPAGQSETAGVPTVFTFNNIQAAATVDEGNNWINMTYGPLTLSRPVAGEASSEPTVAAASVAASTGAYTIGSGSAAIGAGTGITAQNSVPTVDYFGRNRSTTAVTIGAVEYLAPAPTLTSISPNTGVRGTTVGVTLAGTNFATGATIAVSGTGVTVSNLVVVSQTQITANFQIAASAGATARTVTVAVGGQTTNAMTFTVQNPPPPTLASISPNTGARGMNVPVTLTGTNFVNGATIGVSGTGITVANLVVVSPTQITATFQIAGAAAATARNVTVTIAGQTSAAQTFMVTTPPAPTLTGISPSSGSRSQTALGSSYTVTLQGTNFTNNGMTVQVSCALAGCTNGIVPVLTAVNNGATPNTATVTFLIARNATLGTRSVTVTTAGGTSTSTARTFTVSP